MQRPALQKCIAVALALLVWQGAAMVVGLDLLLPSPWQVACRLWSVWREPGFFATVAFSLLRISGGFALGLVLGVLLAVAAGRLRVLGAFAVALCHGHQVRAGGVVHHHLPDLDEHPAAGGVHLVSHGVPGDLFQHPPGH